MAATASSAVRPPKRRRPARNRNSENSAECRAAASRMERAEVPRIAVAARMVQAASGGWSK
jgi:hypothetical protein